MKTRKNNIEKSSCKTRPSKEGKPVDITSLKEFVERRLLPGSPLREVIVTDDDKMSSDAFVTKLPVWLRLSKLQARCQRK